MKRGGRESGVERVQTYQKTGRVDTTGKPVDNFAAANPVALPFCKECQIPSENEIRLDHARWLHERIHALEAELAESKAFHVRDHCIFVVRAEKAQAEVERLRMKLEATTSVVARDDDCAEKLERFLANEMLEGA